MIQAVWNAAALVNAHERATFKILQSPPMDLDQYPGREFCAKTALLPKISACRCRLNHQNAFLFYNSYPRFLRRYDANRNR
jgi:hypothetical protein